MKILIISTIAAIVVFIIKYIFTYRYLTLHKTQEPITSFPASSAWTTALPVALLAFAVATIILIGGSYLYKKFKTNPIPTTASIVENGNKHDVIIEPKPNSLSYEAVVVATTPGEEILWKTPLFTIEQDEYMPTTYENIQDVIVGADTIQVLQKDAPFMKYIVNKKDGSIVSMTPWRTVDTLWKLKK